MMKWIIEIADGEFYDGGHFYSLNINCSNEGMGSPCIDKNEVIETARNYIQTRNIRKKDIERFIDETGLFSVEELFGGCKLERWLNG